MAKKTTCPISRADFHAKAKAITITIGGVPHLAEVKEFSTGSFGWYLNAKTVLDINGVAVPVQINSSFIVVGSKEAPGASGASAGSATTAGEA
jgi:hypothetical protein